MYYYDASDEGICVEFERKKTTRYWFSYFQIPSFMTDPLTIIFDYFGI